MATAKKNTELAPVENFALTTAYDGLDPELAAELKDQMDDLDDESGINCRTIKIPSGGSLAFTVQGGQPLHRFFYGLLAVDAVDVIEVDPLNSQSLERSFAGATHVAGAVVDAARVFAGFAHDAKLGGDLHLGTAFGEEAPDQFFIVVRAIHVGGVEEVDAQIDSPLQHCE